MNDKEKQEFKTLSEKVQELEKLIKENRKYTQKDIFNNKVIFKQPVYDKFGNKIMN